MDLPEPLRLAVDELAQNIPAADLAAASAALSARYRGEVRDGARHVDSKDSARVYAIARLPATFGAIRAAIAHIGDTEVGDMRSQLDVGSGPGTALWAALDQWPALESFTAVEASPEMATLAQQLWTRAGRDASQVTWVQADAYSGAGLGSLPRRFDLVTQAYVLNELAIEPAAAAVQLWERTEKILLILEAGTPAGWKRILAARAALVEQGAHLLAPCPHHARCPLAAPDWCHFSQRVARSKAHRMAKEAELGWEDEKYIYIAASRKELPSGLDAARVLAPPRTASGRVWLKLCQPDGTAAERLVTKREGEVFKRARRLNWGDDFGQKP